MSPSNNKLHKSHPRVWRRVSCIKYIPLCSVGQICQDNCSTAAQCSKWRCWVFIPCLADVKAQNQLGGMNGATFSLLWAVGRRLNLNTAVAYSAWSLHYSGIQCNLYTSPLFCHYSINVTQTKFKFIRKFYISDFSVTGFLHLLSSLYFHVFFHVFSTACDIIGSSGTVIEAV